MVVLKGIMNGLGWINGFVLSIGRTIGWIFLAFMVLIIIIQVIMRYIFNNALPWPDEAARFLMLWLTGLVAPSAFRWGGFVSIDMVKDYLPKRVGLVLTLVLLCISLSVLLVGIQLSHNHVKAGWLFNSSSLKIPLSLIGSKSIAIKLAWMYMSLTVGLYLMISVNIELILRSIAGLFDPSIEVYPQAETEMVGAD